MGPENDKEFVRTVSGRSPGNVDDEGDGPCVKRGEKGGPEEEEEVLNQFTVEGSFRKERVG